MSGTSSEAAPRAPIGGGGDVPSTYSGDAPVKTVGAPVHRLQKGSIRRTRKREGEMRDKVREDGVV